MIKSRTLTLKPFSISNEPVSYIVFNEDEQGIILRSLNDLKNEISKSDDMADAVKAVNELIIKVGNAPIKKFKMVERTDER